MSLSAFLVLFIEKNVAFWGKEEFKQGKCFGKFNLKLPPFIQRPASRSLARGSRALQPPNSQLIGAENTKSSCYFHQGIVRALKMGRCSKWQMSAGVLQLS